MTYNYQREGGYARECESCGWAAPLAQFDRRSAPKRGEKKLICQVCAETDIGTVTDYHLASDNVKLYRTLAQVANLILDKTTGRRP